MRTNFFENLTALNVAGIWKLAIETDGKGNYTVTQLFTTASCGDKAAAQIIPYNLSGTTEDMDEGFFNGITEPTLKAAGLLTNMEAHLKSIEAAKLASKMEQDKKAKTVKPKTEPKSDEADDDIEVAEPKTDKEAKRKAYDEAMGQVNEHNDHCRYAEALALLPSADEYPDKKAEIDKKRADLTRKKEQLERLPQLF